MRFHFYAFKSELANHRYNVTKAVLDFSKFSFCLFVSLVWLYFDLNAYQRNAIAYLNRGEELDSPLNLASEQSIRFSCCVTLLLIIGNLVEWHFNKDRLLQRRLTPTMSNCVKSIPSILFIISQLLSPFIFLFSPILFSNEVTAVDVQSSEFIASIIKPISIQAAIHLFICVTLSRFSQLLLTNKEVYESSARDIFQI